MGKMSHPNVSLKNDGFTLVRILDDAETMRQRMMDEVANFPELLPSVTMGEKVKGVVAGGFGALGNPSSFHNHTVRHLRCRVHVEVMQQGVFESAVRACRDGDPDAARRKPNVSQTRPRDGGEAPGEIRQEGEAVKKIK